MRVTTNDSVKGCLGFLVLSLICVALITTPAELCELNEPRIVRQSEHKYFFVCSDSSIPQLYGIAYVSIRKEGEDIKVLAYKATGAHFLGYLRTNHVYAKEINCPVGKGTRFFYSFEGTPDKEIKVVESAINAPCQIATPTPPQ